MIVSSFKLINISPLISQIYTLFSKYDNYFWQVGHVNSVLQLSVSLQNNLKIYGQSLIKYSGNFNTSTKNRLHFGDD